MRPSLRLVGRFSIGLLLSCGSAPLLALCGNLRVVSTLASEDQKSYVYTPGITPLPGVSSSMTAAALGNFWAAGYGDPIVGPGIDNGDSPASAWLFRSDGVPAFVSGSWAAGGVDGCIDNVVQAPLCTVLLLGDDDGTSGHFAALTSTADIARNYLFARPGGAPIDLAPLPAADLAGRDGQQLLFFHAPEVGPAGLYLDPQCAPETIVVGYRVYQQFVAVGGSAPTDRLRHNGSWSVAFGGELPGGGPLPLALGAEISLDCPGPHDVYYALSLVFDSGYETPYLSAFAAFPCACPGVDDDQDGFCAEPGAFQDCDDADAQVYPGAPDENCDGLNNDCADPDWPAAPAREADLDADGLAECAGDCDDARQSVYPGAPELCDRRNNDCDDPLWPELPQADRDADGDGLSPCEGDCDDQRDNVFPGAPQQCLDQVNNDCDHVAWPGLIGTNEWDADGDGFSACLGDCDESDATTFPGAHEICFDDRNNDCEHPGWPGLAGTAEFDDDADGFSECDGDCTDADGAIYPGAQELCDGVPSDCANPSWPQLPPDEIDADADTLAICEGDCDDLDPSVFPGAPEVCDGVNNDCNDAGWPEPPVGQRDLDADGYLACSGDCDDRQVGVFPGAPPLCDGLNNDCADPAWPQLAGTEERDDDLDGWSECQGDCADDDEEVSPAGSESCNGIDDDCDGVADNLLGASDGDADLVSDSCDNCVEDWNLGQQDLDGDGLGDACDNCPVSFNGGQDDFDADGAGDACDNCLLEFNATQSDTDGNGIGDVCDASDGMIYLYHVGVPPALDWTQEAGLASWNVYRGDLSVLRQTAVYTQPENEVALAQRFCAAAAPPLSDPELPPPGSVAFYLATGSPFGLGLESDLGRDGAGDLRPNTHPCLP